MNAENTTAQTLQIEVTVTAWGSALSQLQAATDLAEHQLLDAAQKGAVWRKKHKGHKLQRIRDINAQTALSDQVFLNYDAEVLRTVALKPSLVSDEVNYSVWDKPSGMLSQGSKWSDHCTITQTVQQLHAKPTYLVHRLDKAANGLIVVAHTKNALKKLAALFADRQVEKHYRVLVHGEFNDQLPCLLNNDIDGKSASTSVLTATYNEIDNTSLLLVSISTGRKHQIRSHLSTHGFPVVGDRLFDGDRAHTQDLQLSACRLAFECPFTHKQKQFEIESPEAGRTPASGNGLQQ